MSIRSLAAVAAMAAALGTPVAFATSGFTPDNSEAGGKSHPMPSKTSREQVRQERVAARTDGSLPRNNGEMADAPRSKTPAGTPGSREQVKREARQAQADGSLRGLNRD